MCTLFGTKPCSPVGGAASIGTGKSSGESKGSSSDNNEGSAGDPGELSKEVALSGIETAPR